MKQSCAAIRATIVCLFGLSSFPSVAQILISAGGYQQNFNSLGSANANWTNNLTLPGWYSAKGNANSTNYFADSGTSTAGGIHSYGVAGVNNLSDRALGSIGATSITYTYGVRFLNDTGTAQTNITVSYTGEQWRSGTTNTPQTLAFSYRISTAPFSNSISGTWTTFSSLSFISPNLAGITNALDGNAGSNRQVFANVVLTGVTLPPGQEIFLRWLDVDDTGFDNGLAIDDLTVNFNTFSQPAAPLITIQPLSQIATQGDNVTFTVAATGYPAPGYQWQFYNTNLPGENAASLSLLGVTTDQAGNYSVLVTNTIGTTNSATVTLTVYPSAPPPPLAFSLLTHNVKGNGATDWSTNAAQVQAIARELQYLNPDIITFNEIPFDLRYEMTNFIAAFLPGFNLAISPGTDGYICSAVASRYAIARASSWLDSVDLRSFGYSNANNALDNFTRDLFEAQITVPGLPRPLHVFTTHLKSSSGGYAEAALKRAAEAAAITNFFATNLFVHYPYDPYTLSGDMNEADTNTLAIQRLVSEPMGLQMINATNPVSGSINTYSSTSPSSRIDYIFPCDLLTANQVSSRVFRTSNLNPLPPSLNANDDQVASDHLPVMLIFGNPYDKPFRLIAITRSNPAVTLQWESVFGQPYRVDASSNLSTWTVLASNLTATGSIFTLSTNAAEPLQFYRVYRQP